MQDRFKFRVWDNQFKKYRNGLGINNNSVCTYDDNVCVLEQCVGLKDNNGKLIYEGDLVKVPDDYEKYGFMAGEVREVYFKDGGFRLKPKRDDVGRGHWLEDTEELEIIGNTHTNHEL